MDSDNYETGYAKSTVTPIPCAAASTKPFTRSVPVGYPNETETTEAQPPKGKGSDLIPFATLELPDNPVLHGLTDSVAKLEEEMDSNLTTVSADLKSEVGLLESRLTDPRTTCD